MVEHPDEDVQRANETAEYVDWISDEQNEDIRETEGVGRALGDAAAGVEVQVLLGPDGPIPGALQPSGVRWTAADLDRCEHGRHSRDHCFGCPHGPHNRFLTRPSTVPLGDRVRTRQEGSELVREQRIGTMVHEEPIWVTVRVYSVGTSPEWESGSGN